MKTTSPQVKFLILLIAIIAIGWVIYPSVTPFRLYEALMGVLVVKELLKFLS